MTKFSPRQSHLLLLSNFAFSLVWAGLVAFFALSADEALAYDGPPAGSTLTLERCIAIALKESPRLEASRFDLLAASEEIRAARASLWPNLTGSATGEVLSGQSTGPFRLVTVGPSTSGVTSLGAAGVGLFGLRLEYPLFKEGSIFGLNDAPAIERGKANEAALAWTAHLTREEVIYRVTQNFLDAVSARNRMAPTERRVTLLERARDITREQQGKGLLLPIDLSTVTDRLNGARSLSDIVHARAVTASLGLTRLLGLAPSTSIRLPSALPPLPALPDAARLSQRLLTVHPSVQAQRATVEKARQDYRLERFRLYPSVTLHGSTFYATDFQNDSHELIGGVTVNVPIFDFGTQLATVRARRATYAAEQARLGSVTDDLFSEVVGIYSQIDALSSRILSLQGEIGKLDRDFRVAQSQEQQGSGSLLTTIDAELALLDKKEELEIDAAQRLVLYANLQKAMGGIWKWIP